ncbi:hypothetical protein V525_17175 [Gordonia alkanivorans CGMCC 6845]|uniref:Uncharacterized protein n=1 Tax=Gordonia alkanivorans CGMCC 6845 TaxID=1423140 RepID=W9DBB0_9ACTN|nr:hypothetical protein V525_17175 [Gordonia alkanivorans CGMCC 6845]
MKIGFRLVDKKQAAVKRSVLELADYFEARVVVQQINGNLYGGRNPPRSSVTCEFYRICALLKTSLVELKGNARR